MFYSNDAISKALKNGDNKSMDYIIMCNNELQTKFQVLFKENCTLRSEREELEEEVDSLTKSRTVLQGYMKNELEYANCWSNKCKVYQVLFYQTIWMVLAHIIIQVCMTITTRMLPQDYESLFIYIYTPVYIIVATSNLFKIYDAPNLLTKKDSEMILKIEKANQYIMDLIDNM
tara:strand:- start:6 stop:527 length:522 start_codon:yes stop_codon:yes gene_type:complete